MKMSIAEIRDYYRKATDKAVAIKELAASEEVSEQTIKFYVRGNTGPERLAGVVIPSEPVKKKMGRPAKNPAAVKPEKKPRIKARPVDKVMPMTEKAPETVNESDKNDVKAPETVNESDKNDVETTESAFGWPKLTVPPLEMSAYKNNPDVQFLHSEPVPVTQEEREMFFADITETPCTESDDSVKEQGEKPKSFLDLVKAAGYSIVPVTPICPAIPIIFDEMHNEPELENRIKWEDRRKASVMHALFKRLKDAKELPTEWVAEWNERCGDGT